MAGAVRALLEASVNNLTEAHMVEGGAGTDDLHYFLDFTTGVLGCPSQEYQQYTTKIQAEYVHLPTASYNQLRLKVRSLAILLRFFGVTSVILMFHYHHIIAVSLQKLS